MAKPKTTTVTVKAGDKEFLVAVEVGTMRAFEKYGKTPEKIVRESSFAVPMNYLLSSNTPIEKQAPTQKQINYAEKLAEQLGQTLPSEIRESKRLIGTYIGEKQLLVQEMDEEAV